METQQVPDTGAGLVDLPIEVLGVICRSLRLEDRVSLSSTCRTLLHSLASSKDAWGTLKFRVCHTDGKTLFPLGWLARRRQGLRRLDLEWGTNSSAAAQLAAYLEGSSLVELKLCNLDLFKEEGGEELQPLATCTALTGLTLLYCSLWCLPSVLEQLPSLADLSLAVNDRLGGASWGRLRQLTALTRLDVNGCGLAALPAEVAGLPALAALDLGNNRGMRDAAEETWAPLAHCSSLTSLGLEWIKFEALPPALAALAPRLVDLNLKAIYEAKGGLFEDEDIWVSVESALWPMFTLAGLTRLNLSHSLGDFPLPEGLSCLAALQDLDVSENRSLRKRQALRALRHLTALTRLSLRKCHLEDVPEEISHLQALKHLDFSDNPLKFRDISWQRLCSLPALARLDFSDCKLERIPPELAWLSSLAELDLRWNHLLGSLEGDSSADADTKWAVLEQLAALTRLDASLCHLDTVPAAATALSRLRVLRLADNAGLGRGGVEALRPIVAMTALQHLDLRNCSLPRELEVDAIPFPLHRLEGWAERIEGLSNEEIRKLRLG